MYFIFERFYGLLLIAPASQPGLGLLEWHKLRWSYDTCNTACGMFLFCILHSEQLGAMRYGAAVAEAGILSFVFSRGRSLWLLYGGYGRERRM